MIKKVERNQAVEKRTCRLINLNRKEKTMTINEAVQKAIQENLSSAIAGELKDFIAMAESNKKKLDNLTERHEELLKNELSQRITISTLESNLSDHQQLYDRETHVALREKKVELEVAKIKLEEVEKRVNAIQHLAETVFKNRSLTTNSVTNVPYYNPSNPSYPNYAPVCKTTKTEEVENNNP